MPGRYEEMKPLCVWAEIWWREQADESAALTEWTQYEYDFNKKKKIKAPACSVSLSLTQFGKFATLAQHAVHLTRGKSYIRASVPLVNCFQLVSDHILYADTLLFETDTVSCYYMNSILTKHKNKRLNCLNNASLLKDSYLTSRCLFKLPLPLRWGKHWRGK